MLKLYHGRTSVCSVKVRLALAEKGQSFESQVLTLRGDQFDPEYMKLNPNAVVPTLIHDGKVIIESTVIIHYVDDTFDDPSLMPADPLARARVHMTAKLMDEFVHNSCTALSFATANRTHLERLSPQELEAELATSPSRARSDAKREVIKHGLEAPLVAEAVDHFEKLLDLIEASVKDGPQARPTRSPMSRQRPMCGASPSSSSRECGTGVRVLPRGTTASGNGRHSRQPSSDG
jgi:glutathione S-transferase